MVYHGLHVEKAGYTHLEAARCRISAIRSLLPWLDTSPYHDTNEAGVTSFFEEEADVAKHIAISHPTNLRNHSLRARVYGPWMVLGLCLCLITNYT